MKIANITSAIVFTTLLVSGAVLGVDYGGYTVGAFILFVVTVLAS